MVKLKAGSLPRVFWVLWVGTLLNRLGYVVQPFLALFLSTEWDLSPAVVGAVLSCFGLGALFSQPVGGYLADRFGHRRILVLGMLASAATMVVMPLAPNVVVVAVVATLYGLAIDLYRPAVTAIVVHSVSAVDRKKAFGLLYWAVNLGSSVAGVAGGVLAANSFWLLFVLDALTCVAFAVTAAKFVPADRPLSRSQGPRQRYPLRDGLLIGLTASFFVFAFLVVQAFVTLPMVMAQDSLGPTAYGLVFATNPVVIIVVQPLVMGWLARLPSHTVYVTALAILGVGFGLTAFASTVPVYMATVVVWTCGEIAIAASGPALVADIAPADMQARYSGVFGTAFGAASLVGPVAGAALLQTYGSGLLWGTCALAGVASALVIATLGPAVRRRTEEMSRQTGAYAD